MPFAQEFGRSGVHFLSELIGFLLTRRAAKVIEGAGRGAACPLPAKTLGRVRASFPRARPYLVASRSRLAIVVDLEPRGVCVRRVNRGSLGKRRQ
jgi:hypothetical protein